MLKQIALALVAVTSFAHAGGIHGLPVGGITFHKSKQVITHVESEGTVKRVSRNHPYSKYIIEIPVTVAPKSACTKITGQANIVENDQIVEIAVMGSTPSAACIAVMPRPIDMTVKFEMNILTGGFVAANPIQKQTVNLFGKGRYQVTLNMDNKVVTLKAVGNVPQ